MQFLLTSHPNLSNFVAETPVVFYLLRDTYPFITYIWFCFGGNNIVRINTIRNKCFDPLITYLSPFLTAVVRIPATSLPP
jgi:hypothetical protein